MSRKKIVFLTGAGISVESGLSTFRDSNGLWENYDPAVVATHSGWEANSEYVNSFYNMLRVKYKDVQPNEAHKLIASLEDEYEVVVVTQNVDNLHEAAGSSKIIHLHGDMLKACSSANVEDEECHVILPCEGFGESGLEIPKNALAKDGSLLRPYIVFFEEPVPNITKASEEIKNADMLVVVGTSLNVYPAAALIYDLPVEKDIYVIDPNTVNDDAMLTNNLVIKIKKTASAGMKEFIDVLKNKNAIE